MSESSSYFRPGLPGIKKIAVLVNFVCIAPGAKKVFLSGDFNKWDATACPLKRQIDGSWTGQLTLPHGHHQYQFVIDDKPALDPRAQGVARNEKNEKVSLLAVS